MPALQVRDFPPALYDELKACAAANHRSIAQQTIIAVEEMLARASEILAASPPRAEAACADAVPSQVRTSLPHATSWHDSEGIRALRARKREQAFANFDKLDWKGKGPTTEEIVAFVRESRDERTDRILASMNPFADDDLDEVAL